MAKIARFRNLALILGLLVPVRLALAGSLFVSPGPGQLCRTAIVNAARAFAIPLGLLGAIGRVESGRRDRVSGVFLPWPWTVDADGSGSFYPSKAAAIAAVKEFRAAGVRSIDVGCMQISLLHHPDAFASLTQAFDPAANAAYAARFLRKLHTETRSWPEAAAFYHSATPEFALPYERRVMETWSAAAQRMTGIPPPLPVVFEGARRRSPPMLATPRPFAGRAGALMLSTLGKAPALPRVFGPPVLTSRGRASYRRSPVLIAADSLHGGR